MDSDDAIAILRNKLSRQRQADALRKNDQVDWHGRTRTVADVDLHAARVRVWFTDQTHVTVPADRLFTLTRS